MGWTKRWSKRLRALLRKDTVERELDEELAYHLEMETQKNLGAGMSPEEARRQARVAFDGVERYKESDLGPGRVGSRASVAARFRDVA